MNAASALQRAVAEGRHSAAWSTVCDGCREWVDGIYHVTLDKKRLCLGCFDRLSGRNTDLANAVGRSSRGGREAPGPHAAGDSRPSPTGQGTGTVAASQAAALSPAAARTGDQTRPGPGPTSTVACPLFGEPGGGA